LSNKLSVLKKEGKINQEEYENYLLYVGNDVGATYLKRKLEAVLMEEPVTPTSELFVWHDGRRSVWRDIKHMIMKVEFLLKGDKNDGSN